MLGKEIEVEFFYLRLFEIISYGRKADKILEELGFDEGGLDSLGDSRMNFSGYYLLGYYLTVASLGFGT